MKLKPYKIPILMAVAAIIYTVLTKIIPDFKAKKQQWLAKTHGTMLMLGGEGEITDYKLMQYTVSDDNYKNLKNWLSYAVSFFLILFTGFSVLQALLKTKW